MKITYTGKSLLFNGKPGVTQGLPRKPVRWTGSFLVADTAGNAELAEWKPGSGGPMTYLQAKELAFRLLDEQANRVEAAHQLPIKKAAFTLMSR